MSDMTTDLAAVRQAAEQMANEWHNPSDCELIRAEYTEAEVTLS